MKNVDVTPLFATPLYTSNIDVDSNTINVLDQEKYDTMYHNEKCCITSNKDLLNKKEFQHLKNKIYDHVNNFMVNILKMQLDKKEIFISKSWGVKLLKEGYANDHIHKNSMFSGVYYVSVNKNLGGNIKFSNKYNNINDNYLEFDYNEYNVYNSAFWRLGPSSGDLYLFPSNLTHEVEINKSNLPRLSIAFNVFVTGEFGRGETYLRINK